MTNFPRFDSYVCPGDHVSIEVDGFVVKARIRHDDNADAPDQMGDGFWPSLDPKSAGYIGPKSPRTLRRHHAKALAVMDAWERNEWWYCGIIVTVFKGGIELAHADLWGIEANYPGSDNAYLSDVADELLNEALDEARAKIATLCAA